MWYKTKESNPSETWSKQILPFQTPLAAACCSTLSIFSLLETRVRHGHGARQVTTIIANPDPAQDEGDAASEHSSLRPPPLTWKLVAILLVTFIGFGSQWSGGITGAMKTTMKKEMKIDNTQFALLEASEDFMVTALMLVSGIVTDRIGGAG